LPISKTEHYKFGEGNAAKKMVDVIKDIKIDQKFLRKQLDFPEN